MTISYTRYVDITSGVGGAPTVGTRTLVGRIFTGNDILPPQSYITFTSAAEVGNYFGLSSEEYYRSLFYFGWVSKNQLQPQSLQFARWVNTAVAPMVFPAQANGSVLANWTSISNGSFILTMGGFTFSLTGLSFTGASTLANVATIIQDAIQAESGGGAVWTGATVAYQATGMFQGGFILVGGATDVVTNPLIVAAGGGGTDITGAGLLGWVPEGVNVQGNYISGAIWATGSAVETITTTLANSANASNNFGSFLFLNNLNLTLSQVIQAANWNNAENVLFMYTQEVTPANAATWAADSGGVGLIGGTGLTLTSPTSSQTGVVVSAANTVTSLQNTANLLVGQLLSGTNIPAGTTIASIVSGTSITMSANATGSATETITFYPVEFPEMVPMMIEAATNYSGLNTVQNYMFQQFPGLTPSVTTDAQANTYDALGINYYGVTQTAGQQVAFYQTGVLMGTATDITNMNSYANEQWLKDAAGAAIGNLLIASLQVPANQQGENMILGILQGVINQALNNGTISVGKTLTTLQQSFITTETGDPDAWYSVQNNGYWIGVEITGAGTAPVVYTATYTLIYSQDDVIRKVVGTDTLI